MDYRGVRTSVLPIDDDIPWHSVRLVTEVVVISVGGLYEGHDIDPVRIHHQNQIARVDGSQRAFLLMHHRAGLDDDHRGEGAGSNPHGP